MKKKRNIILCLSISIVGILLFLLFFNRSNLCTPKDDLTSIVETGDLVFSIGESIKSDIVRFLGKDSDCKYSHIGIIIKKDNDYRIVHMSSDLGYIASQSLNDFIKTADSSGLGIYRIETPIDKIRLTEIVDSLLMREKKFDDDFNLEDDEKYYCTEFIYKIFRDMKSEVYYDFKFENHIYPDDIINSLSMKKIAEIN